MSTLTTIIPGAYSLPEDHEPSDADYAWEASLDDPADTLSELDFTTEALSHEDALIAAWEEVNAATNRATAEHMGGVWDWN
jgi:hypothetical protein